MSPLVLKRASLSRPSGEWREDDYDVLDDGGDGSVREKLAGRVGPDRAAEAAALSSSVPQKSQLVCQYSVTGATIGAAAPHSIFKPLFCPMKHLLAACALVFATAAHAQMPQHAVIQPRHILPPEEFDRPYDGLLIERKDWNLMGKVCGSFRLACALPEDGRCAIFLPPEEYLVSLDLTIDDLRRHEVTHCNGWPGSLATGR